MRNCTGQNLKQDINISKGNFPDPWEEESRTPTKVFHPPWQFPLDPQHEIEAGRPVDGILAPASDPNLLMISAGSNQEAATAASILLEEELKINAVQATRLWQQIRDGLTLLCLQENAVS